MLKLKLNLKNMKKAKYNKTELTVDTQGLND